MIKSRKETKKPSDGFSEYDVGIQSKRPTRLRIPIPRIFQTKQPLEAPTSRFPTVIAGHSVSYDPESKLFTITGIHDSVGETFYFADLPQDIKNEIKKKRLHKPTT